MSYSLVDTCDISHQNEAYLGSEETIGFSEQRRPLTVKFFGSTNASLRVFVMAGQHGDEAYARKAIRHLVKAFSNPGKFQSMFKNIRLAVLENANPDGAAKRTRNNAIDIDLNRDHLLLDGRENQAIHWFIESWKPHSVIDVHNFPSRRKHLLAKDRVIYYDVFIDVPTNPAVRLSIDDDQISDMIRHVLSDLSSRGISCERYILVKPSGRARHSTPDIVDARNFLALRYGVLAVLIEGRSPTRQEGHSGRKHAILAQYRAILSVMRQLESNRKRLLEHAKRTTTVPIRYKYVVSGRPLKMIFRNSKTNSPESVLLSDYASDLLITKFVDTPAAYAIPMSNSKTVEILRRHGFSFSRSDKVMPVEYYVKKKKIREKRSLQDYAIFPVGQDGVNALVLMLEPRSKYGLNRYSDLQLQDSKYPVYRILRLFMND